MQDILLPIEEYLIIGHYSLKSNGFRYISSTISIALNLNTGNSSYLWLEGEIKNRIYKEDKTNINKDKLLQPISNVIIFNIKK